MDNEKCRELLKKSFMSGSRMANRLYEIRMKSYDPKSVVELVEEWDKVAEAIGELLTEKALDNS